MISTKCAALLVCVAVLSGVVAFVGAWMLFALAAIYAKQAFGYHITFSGAPLLAVLLVIAGLASAAATTLAYRVSVVRRQQQPPDG